MSTLNSNDNQQNLEFDLLNENNYDKSWNWPLIGKWALTIVVFIAAPVFLYFKPTDYTPLVEVLLNIFLFLMAYWVGNASEISKAIRSANDRWVPQAESVIFRLITLHNNVKRFSQSMSCSSERSEEQLPELKEVEFKAVRVKMKSDCDATSQRLIDISNQLEDAIEDWRRFIIANCNGDECERIFEAIQQREQRLQVNPD